MWLFKATKAPNYWNYVVENISKLEKIVVKNADGVSYSGGSIAEFGWDTKHAGINILVSKVSIYWSCSFNCFMLVLLKFSW